MQTGDLYVVGAENYADYRAQLLPWPECEKRLPAYCAALGISARGEDFAAALKNELTKAAAEVDAGFSGNSALSIDADGTPHLKQLSTIAQPDGLAEFEVEIRARMPERHLLDILRRAEHWAHYTRHFGPPSVPIQSLHKPCGAISSRFSATVAILVPIRPPGMPPK